MFRAVSVNRRPRVLVGAGLVCLAGVLAACGNGAGPASDNPSSSAQAAADNQAQGSGGSSTTITMEALAGHEEIRSHIGGKVEFVNRPASSQLSYYRISDGMRMGTESETIARPALSLIKLYLAAYVLEHGEVTDRYEALDMLTNSSDQSASEIYERYPDSVDAIAREYGLTSTRGADQWGYSVTSTLDVVNFLVQLMEKDPTHPILVAMSQSDAIAADGYVQDFGTAKLSNVLGSKWGWSDDWTLHSSVSFGANFLVAAAVSGSSTDLTDFVKRQVTVDNLNKATDQFLDEEKRQVPHSTFTLKEPASVEK